ncbi:transposase [Gordonia sp. (in: high G+C Gram-positive bacteria)]|uniref:transposase n=1 Tax=Gordonia sp. (in: high G+C Gram-positive bacteria) TaxID=84139 RepID=UPI003C74ADBF
MARKNYSDEFRRRAVDLFDATPGATISAIADDLGVSRGALKTWVDRYDRQSNDTVAGRSCIGRQAGVSGSPDRAAGSGEQGAARRADQARRRA